jgi:hypothetical protein
LIRTAVARGHLAGTLGASHTCVVGIRRERFTHDGKNERRNQLNSDDELEVMR